MEGENRNRICMEIHRLDNIITRILQAKVREAGFDEVTLMHGWIIAYLYGSRDRQVYQRDLERACQIGRSTVTNIIKLMEKKGLICREPVENDARLKRVMLTPKGYKHREVVDNALEKVGDRMLEGIDPGELEVFRRVLGRMIRNLGEGQRPCRERKACQDWKKEE